MRRTNVAALAVALTGAVGCVPTVTHSPRIEPGPSAEMSIGFGGIGDTMPGWPPFGFPPASAGLAFGWRDTSLDAGLRFGAGLDIPFEFDLDAYAQIPSRLLLGFDGGVGVGALVPSPAATVPMPYAELGRIRGDRGPYAIVAYIHQRVDANRVFGPGAIRRDDGLSTTLAYQFSDGVVRARPFATLVFGHRYIKECMGKFSDCSSLATPHALFVGLSVERAFRR
jgi:hypothetical protein